MGKQARQQRRNATKRPPGAAAPKRDQTGPDRAGPAPSAASKKTGSREPARPDRSGKVHPVGRSGRDSSIMQSAVDFAYRPYRTASGSTKRRRRPQSPAISGFPAVVRGGWLGFVVLIFGDLITLITGRGSGLVLYWVAAAAYALAGNRAASASLGSVRIAARDGALAAMFAYSLTIPLRQAVHDQITLLGTVVALVAALIVGGLAGAIVARARRRDGPPGAAA